MNTQYIIIHKKNKEAEETIRGGKGSNTPKFFNSMNGCYYDYLKN